MKSELTSYYFKLGADGRTPVPVTDLLEWADAFNRCNDDKTRRVGWDYDNDKLVTVSTTFLGLEHGHDDQGRPLLFETMIFGGPHDQYQDRYATWSQAECGHRYACDLAGLTQRQIGSDPV